MSEDLLQRKLQRAERSIGILEQMIEDKTRELFLSNESLRAANEDFAELLQVMPGALVVVDADGGIMRVNRATLQILGYAKDELTGQPATRVFGDLADPKEIAGLPPRREDDWLDAKGEKIPMLISASTQVAIQTGKARSTICVGADLRERRQLEIELRHAQKLESVGQLAAGIAHEINTPMQFIGDNVHFIGEAMASLLRLVDCYEVALEAQPAVSDEVRGGLESARAEANLSFVRKRAARAVERTLMGVERVSSIVSAMKAFSHPSEEKALVDLNKVSAARSPSLWPRGRSSGGWDRERAEWGVQLVGVELGAGRGPIVWRELEVSIARPIRQDA